MKLIVNNITYDDALTVAVALGRDFKKVEDKAKEKGKKTKSRAEIIADLKKAR